MLALCAAIPALTPIAGRADQAPAPGRPALTANDWLSVLNFYRRTAKVPTVRENDYFSRGARLHSRYMVLAGDSGHDETDSSRYHTAEGERAGLSSEVFASTDASITDREAIEGWMASPFHAAGLIDPALRSTGYGAYRAPDRSRGWRIGGTLDVLRGRATTSSSRIVTWPGNGVQVPLTMYPGSEYPDPVSSCRGYTGDVGLPIIARIPNAGALRGAAFRQDGAAQPFCVFDERTYRSRSIAEQSRGRSILAALDTVVIVPRSPLKPGSRYDISIGTARASVSWWFTVGEVTPPRNVRMSPSTPAFQTAASFTPTWGATDPESGVASYEVRYRAAAPTGSFGSWRSLGTIFGTSTTFPGRPGYTYCFRVRAADRSGNVSGWSPSRCTAVPLRTTDMTLSGTWIRQVGVQYYEMSASTSVTQGASATVPRASARRAVLIATRCPACGSVDVLVDGRRIARVSLVSSSFAPMSMIPLPWPALRTGRIAIVDASPTGTPVTIEGLGVSRV